MEIKGTFRLISYWKRLCYRGLQRIGYFLAGLENPNLQLNPSPCDASLTASMLSPKKTVHSIVIVSFHKSAGFSLSEIVADLIFVLS